MTGHVSEAQSAIRAVAATLRRKTRHAIGKASHDLGEVLFLVLVGVSLRPHDAGAQRPGLDTALLTAQWSSTARQLPENRYLALRFRQSLTPEEKRTSLVRFDSY